MKWRDNFAGLGMIYAHARKRRAGTWAPKAIGERTLRQTRITLAGKRLGLLRPMFLPTTLLGTLFLATPVMKMDALVAAADDISHETGEIKSKSLLEISGVAASRQNPDILWMHNDGVSKHVYAVKTTGKVVHQIVPDVQVEDLEDIAIGPGPEKGVDYIHLGDIGDNDSKRREVRVIRFAEPSLQDAQGQPATATCQVFRLVYPDGPRDAETLMVDPQTGDLVLATKGKNETRVYVAPAASLKGDNLTKLNLVATLDVDSVSAGDISRDGTLIALRREEIGWLWNRHRGESLRAALARKPRKIPVLGKKQAKNGESIAFHPDGRGYYTTSEGRRGSIYFFDLPPTSDP